MKIVGIISSSNENGNGATLVREILAGARERKAETAEVLLSKLTIGYCRGCLACMAKGRCVQDDDFEALRAQLAGADGIVLSTPVFAAAPCSRLKTLLDRLGIFEYMTGATLAGKYFAAVATAKTGGADKTVAYLESFAEGGIFGNAYVSGSLPAVLRKGLSAADALDLMGKARRLGATLVDDFENHRTSRARQLFSRFFMRNFVRPAVSKAIIEHRDGAMGGVYANLKERKLLA